MSAYCLAAVAPPRRRSAAVGAFVVGIRVIAEIPGGVKVHHERGGELVQVRFHHRDRLNGFGLFHVLGDFHVEPSGLVPRPEERARGNGLRHGSLLLLLLRLLLLERRETVRGPHSAAAAAAAADAAGRSGSNEREALVVLRALLAADLRFHGVTELPGTANHLAEVLGVLEGAAVVARRARLALDGAGSLGLAALAVSPGVALGVAVGALRLGESRAAGLAADLVLDVVRFYHLLRLARVVAELAELRALLGLRHDVQEN